MEVARWSSAEPRSHAPPALVCEFTFPVLCVWNMHIIPILAGMSRYSSFHSTVYNIWLDGLVSILIGYIVSVCTLWYNPKQNIPCLIPVIPVQDNTCISSDMEDIWKIELNMHNIYVYISQALTAVLIPEK